MFRDDQEVFEAAMAATIARIQCDGDQAPTRLEPLFTVLADRIFDSGLSVKVALREAGIRDKSVGRAFRAVTDTTISEYIAEARVEVAEAAIKTTDLKPAWISEQVGFTHHPTFEDTYVRQRGQPPSEVTRERLPAPLIDDHESLLAGRGLLEDDAAERHVKRLLRIYPKVEAKLAEECRPAAKRVVDGARVGSRLDELEAEAFWRKIRDLPLEDQRRTLGEVEFHSTELFDLLRKESRLAGRKCRKRGVEIAELALVSLEGSGEVFGERIHDLRALAWAWIGNAHRLALDFSAAAAAFEEADREWTRPRARPDKSVLAHVRLRRGALWLWRREYAEATQELDRSCSIFRKLGETREEALALITRSRISIYANKLSHAVEDLRKAAGLIDENEEPELAFAIRGNLANALARAGETGTAMKELEHARELDRLLENNALGKPKLSLIAGYLSEQEGDVRAARRQYEEALAGFRAAEELRYFGIVAVDLMVVYAKQNDFRRVVTLAAEATPILESQQLHEETVAAVHLMKAAVEAGSCSKQLLSDLRHALRWDPLAM